ncbi:hypothetical protein EXIGLDRAFT_472396 [Exidia glandulosa HHB12029]|uniref:Uncharacterized protein n=1 Tax=Exidia glandulosa HHB12029 TaxID=1314781 RepID=A0A165JX73_EXIGL|nr:hypothetical protein EXIGLDRAFT_472396 [Exidia glandulosa HHB12029]
MFGWLNFSQRSGLKVRITGTYTSSLTRLDAPASGFGWHLRRAIYAYAIHGRQPVLLTDPPHGLVTLSVGRFVSAQIGSAPNLIMDERLIFLNLLRWLPVSPYYSIHGLVSNLAHDGFPEFAVRPSAADAALFEGMAVVLWRMLHGDPLSMFAQAIHPEPIWMDADARICLTSWDGVQPRQFYEPPSSCSRELVTIGETSDECFAWFQNAHTPFLIPRSTPDIRLLFIVETDGGHVVLVALLSPSESTRNLRPRQFMAVPDASTFFSESAAEHSKWLAILRSFPELAYSTRVHCSFPVLSILCFAQPYSRSSPYNPPVATLKPDHFLYYTGDEREADLLAPDVTIET